MKKLLSLAALVIGLNAYQIDIKSGWQLKGALEDINVTDVFNEAEIISVWTYNDENGKWRAYVPNMNVNLDSYGIEPLNIIHKGEGFWVNANNNLFIETNTDYGNFYYDDNIITEDNLIDKPTTFELSDIANKTFKFFWEDDFIDLTFDSNGIANMEIDGKNYEIKLENGIIKAYENGVLISKYKKVKADNNGIIVFGTDLDLEYNNTFSYLEPWLTTISPVDMSTLNYPFTVYEAHYGVEKITFKNNKIVFESGWELNSTIENGKIVAINEYVSDDGNYGHITTYQVQYIGEVDKYKIPKIEGYWEHWEINDDLIGVTFNNIIDTNQSIYGYILHSDGTASTTYNSDADITYQLINSTEINLTECYDIDSCYTRNITIDPNTGKITENDTFSFVTIHSEDPIITNYVSNNYRVLPNKRVIKDRILQKYKKLRKKPF